MVQSPHKSTRRASLELNVPRSTVYHIARHVLHLFPYRSSREALRIDLCGLCTMAAPTRFVVSSPVLGRPERFRWRIVPVLSNCLNQFLMHLPVGAVSVPYSLRNSRWTRIVLSNGDRHFSCILLAFAHITMSQERLTNLAIISIESRRAERINFKEIIDEFASRKARKVRL